MAKKNETMTMETMFQMMMDRMDAMDARIDEAVKGSKTTKKTSKKAEKAETVNVVDEVTYRTQEFHKELKAAGMVSGKDYWAHTNKETKVTRVYACVPHAHSEWARKLEALGFAPTKAYGGSTPAFAMYSRITKDLKVDLFKFDK